MKIAFDVHGVLDSNATMRELMRFHHNAGHMVYIISGQLLDDQMCKVLKEKDLFNYYDIYMSVTHFLGDKVTWNGNMPWAPDEDWNPAKAKMCLAEGIDILFDDSPTYGKYFDNIPTTYVRVENPNRVIYDVRG